MRRRAEGPRELTPMRERWLSLAAGRRYSSERWRSARAARRDLLIVGRILRRHGVEPTRGAILDAPCGAGRLFPLLSQAGAPYVGLDVSAAMLDQFDGAARGRLVLGAVGHLPFRDEAFDVVVVCRLLHHVQAEEELAAIVHDLVRVSTRLVVASFWDASSLPALRTRIGLRHDEGPSGRRPISKPLLRAAFARAGADVLAFHHSFRFVSQQTFLVANKRARVSRPRAEVVLGLRAAEQLDYGSGGVLGRA